MSTDPLQFRRVRLGSDGGTDLDTEGAATNDLDEDLLAHRADELPAVDWSTLGRSEQQFFNAILEQLYVGKSALVRAHDSVRSRLTGADRVELKILFEHIIDHQATHVRAVDSIRERLREVEEDGPSKEPDLSPLVAYFDAVTERRDYDDREPLSETDELTATAMAVAQISYGVASQTGYGVLTVFLERNGVLDECAEVLDALRVSDQKLADSIARRRRDLRDDWPDIDSHADRQVENGLVACTDLVRGMQDRFDFLSLGLVPDEFVAFALDRYIEISERAAGSR